ncbi:MAG TPA: hypothetical protein VFX42_06235 [Gemmatimonadales bacterium]|nr:hypothetical protein [Gemmatimonadales bacterium]
MRTLHIPAWGAGVLALLCACHRSPSRPASSSASAAPSSLAAQSHPTHVDSFVPRELALERFRKGGTRVVELAHAEKSRDALVRAFVHALERRDTAEFRRLIVSRDEFAWLFYPTSAQGLPPYSLNPDLMWFMMVEQGNQGLRRALNRLGGKHLAYVGYRCEGAALKEGENMLWGPCLVRLEEAPGDTAEARLFGPILQRDGRFKFLSYSNKL